MHISLRPLVICALLMGGFSVAGAPAPVWAQGQTPKATLKVGDAAPELSIATWWQDKTLAKFEKNRVYLVDFWASWCPPCRASFPELAKFKAKYGSEGLEVVAVSIDDNPDDAAQFLTTQGGKFDFFVGVDKDGASWKNWGTAAGCNSIPTTFLVSATGKILWVGHPVEVEKQILPALADIPLDALPTPAK